MCGDTVAARRRSSSPSSVVSFIVFVSSISLESDVCSRLSPESRDTERYFCGTAVFENKYKLPERSVLRARRILLWRPRSLFEEGAAHNVS